MKLELMDKATVGLVMKVENGRAELALLEKEISVNLPIPKQYKELCEVGTKWVIMEEAGEYQFAIKSGGKRNE